MRSFTTTNNKIVNVLQNTVEISQASILNGNAEENKKCQYIKFIMQ